VDYAVRNEEKAAIWKEKSSSIEEWTGTSFQNFSINFLEETFSSMSIFFISFIVLFIQ